jgi:hypothetical protein
MQREVAGCEGMSQIVLEQLPIGSDELHVGLEAARRAARFLGPVKRQVGLAEQRLGVRVVGTRKGKSDRRANRKGSMADIVGDRDVPNASFGELLRLLSRAASRQDDLEFVASQSPT